MNRSTDRIVTTHGGRLPAPGVIGELLAAREANDAAALAQLTHAGIVETLTRQSEIGIDVPSDGEFYKVNFRNPLYYEGRFTGIEARQSEPGELTWAGQRSPESLDPRFERLFAYLARAGWIDAGLPPVPGFYPGEVGTRFVVSGPLGYRGRAAIEAELRVTTAALAEVGLAPADAFYPLLGPFWLSHFIFNEYYATDEDFIDALAAALREEYLAVIDAGFILQVDDPALADKFAMFNPPLSIAEYRRHCEHRIGATNDALRGIPEERIRYHTCWGSFHYPHTRDIGLEHIIDLLLKVNAQAYSIEAASIGHQLDHRVWERVRLPEGKILIPGVIAHSTSNQVEPPELVADRIETYARIVGRENVIAGVDCGPGGRCHDDIAWAKLRSLAEGAELASARLFG